MPRTYTKLENLAEEVFRRKEAGETNRQIGEKHGLSKKQIKQLVSRQNRKRRMIEVGYLLLPKGRPRKDAGTEEVRRNNKLIQLRMTVDLLRNFLFKAGRR